MYRRQDDWTSLPAFCSTQQLHLKVPQCASLPSFQKRTFWALTRRTLCHTSLCLSVPSVVRRWWMMVILARSCHSSVLTFHCSLASLGVTSISLIRAESTLGQQGAVRTRCFARAQGYGDQKSLLQYLALGTVTRVIWEGAGRRETRASVVSLLVERRLLLAGVSSEKLKPLSGHRNVLLRLNLRTDVRRHPALLPNWPHPGLCRLVCLVLLVWMCNRFSRRSVVGLSEELLPAAKKVSSRERQIAHLSEQLHHLRGRIDKQSESVRKHSEHLQLVVDKLEGLNRKRLKKKLSTVSSKLTQSSSPARSPLASAPCSPTVSMVDHEIC